MSIGERIKQARRSEKMSLRALASRIGVSPMAISKYERDQDIPSSGVLLRMAQALNVKIDFFFRSPIVRVQLQAYRKHHSLGIKEQEAIGMRIQEWIERYLEVESLFHDGEVNVNLPVYKIKSLDEVEIAAEKLRESWNLGVDPIESIIQLLEDRNLKVGIISGFDHFDACTLKANENPVIVTKAELPGDRQRFNIAHELGHLIIEADADIDIEKAASRFAGAFLVPANTARFELGTHRSKLEVKELFLLKSKYGISMQAWIYRARDLEIITPLVAESLFRLFRANNWHKQEPWEQYPSEKPLRMQRLIYRALAEDLISRSRAEELFGGHVHPQSTLGAMQPDDSTFHTGY